MLGQTILQWTKLESFVELVLCEPSVQLVKHAIAVSCLAAENTTLQQLVYTGHLQDY